MEFSILPLLLTAVGSYFLIKLSFFFILHPFKTARRGFRAIKDARAVRSFTLALAGTLGVGNVFGVALGILIGGAGSLFWLLISMIFAMVIKYSEVVLSSDNLCHGRDTHGGFFYVIKASCGRAGKYLSVIYSLATLALSLVLGGALQSNAVEESLVSVLHIPRFPLALGFAFFTFLLIIGGTVKIEKITAIIIPTTTFIYIFMTLFIICGHIDRIETVIVEIVTSAFSAKSAVGGAVGFLLSAPVKEGFVRGLLSNEAGAGTSSMAHARSGVISPASAGILGIFEVWFDTGVICLLTGLSILMSVDDVSIFSGGMELVMYTVGNAMGILGKYTALFCVLSFALATVICWYYYGMESWTSVFGTKTRAVFTPIFLTSVFLGFYINSFVLVAVTDTLMTIATVLTLFALIKNSDRIKFLSENGGVIYSDVSRIKSLRIKGGVFSRGRKRR